MEFKFFIVQRANFLFLIRVYYFYRLFIGRQYYPISISRITDMVIPVLVEKDLRRSTPS
jgi:hypothetical protein